MRLTFSGAGEASTSVVATSAASGVRRSQRERQPPQRLQDFEVILDASVNADGELIHFALLVATEPLNYEEALRDKRWIHAME